MWLKKNEQEYNYSTENNSVLYENIFIIKYNNVFFAWELLETDFTKLIISKKYRLPNNKLKKFKNPESLFLICEKCLKGFVKSLNYESHRGN